jgi:hypothetical protein
MTGYKLLEDFEGVAVQYVGVYVLRWRSEWGEPQFAFVEDDDADTERDALRAQLAQVTAERDQARARCVNADAAITALLDTIKVASTRAPILTVKAAMDVAEAYPEYETPYGDDAAYMHGEEPGKG